ncbi:hypothetical protein WN943_027327 [Citrus x changshan-huyou]
MPSDDNLDNDDQKAVLVKVSNMSSLKALSLIKQRLTEQQYEVFKETCFGHFVYLQDLKFAGQIVHALLLRVVILYEVISEFGQKFATEKGDLKVPRIFKWFYKNKIMADVINKALKEKDTFTVATTLHATGSDGSNEIAQHYMQWFLASEIAWKHATITDDISHTPFNAPSPGFFPSPHNASTFQRTTPFHEKISKNKIYDKLSKIEEKVQKIDVLEAKLDNITKDLWRMTKLLEEFLASFNVGKDSLTYQPPAHDPPTSVASDVVIDKMDVQLPAHDPHISVASHVDHDKIDDQPLAHDHQTAGTAHVDADKIDVERKLEHLYSVYVINPEKVWTNNATNYVVDYAKGEKLKCVVHWKDVSKVYIPLHPKQDHWALAQFDLQKEIIFVYDSMLDYMNDSAFEKELLPFVVMMPLILDRISWYTSHSDDNSLTRKWKAVRVSDIPQQKNNNDCGVFVMFYLEALVYGLDIPYDVRTQAGINSYRKQVATRLFSDKKLIEECD